VRGELQLVEVVDEHGVDDLELLVAEVPLGRPGKLAVAERAALGHPRRLEVQSAGEQRGVQMLLQIRHPWRRTRGVREVPREPDPALDLGEHVRDIDVRDESVELGPQAHGLGVLLERLRGRELEAIGTKDDFVSVEDARTLEKEMRDAGVSVEFEFYEGAGHAFFNDTNRLGTYDRDAAQRSWERSTTFLREHLG